METLQQITVIENNNSRVLTTAQIAQAYGTSTQTITVNFNRNKNRYQEGKHYHVLKGALLQAFRATYQFVMLPKNVHTFYLWTESGALLHAKSLNTQKAWEVYIHLVDNYFREKNEQLNALVKLTKEALQISNDICDLQTRKIDILTEKISVLKHTSTIAVGEQEQLRLAARSKMINIFGGKNTVSYRMYALKVYRKLWREYRKYFRIDSYRNTPEYRFNEGLAFIRAWELDRSFRKVLRQLEKDFKGYLETFFDDSDNDGYKKLLAEHPAIIDEYINI